MTEEVAIYRVRRDLALGLLVKVVLICAVVASVVFAPPSARMAACMGVLAVWIALGVTSARSSRLASDSPALIATGRFEEAERQIDQAVRAFSLFGPAKLRALHQLAMLRHAQHRWLESAALCRAVLGQKPGSSTGLTKPSSMMLANSLLELNDLNGAYASILGLYGQQMSLEEVMHLLALQLDYEAKIGAWAHMFTAATVKVQLAELMPPPVAARVQALLALAALKCGRTDWADWLRQRAEMLADAKDLAGDRPMLAELWKKPE